MTAWWLAAAAFAGRLEVHTTKPVILLVDNEPIDFLEGRLVVTTAPLREGPHVVEVRTLMGKRITEIEVPVPHDQIVRVEYAERRLQITEHRMMFGGAIVPEVVAPVESKVDVPDVSDVPEREGSPNVKVGSLEFVLPSSATVIVGSSALAYGKATESFLATEQLPGKVDVSVALDDAELFAGPLEVREGNNYRCLKAEGTLECSYSQPQQGLPEVSRALFDREIADVLAATNPDPEAATGPVRVLFTIRDPWDFSTVFLDGARVAKFRHGDTEHEVKVQSGVHVVEIRGFDDQRWYRAKLSAPVGTPIEIAYGEDEGVEVRSSNGTWSEF